AAAVSTLDCKNWRRLTGENSRDMAHSLNASLKTNIGMHGLAILSSPSRNTASTCPAMDEPKTLIDKLWDDHEIVRRDDGEALLWVDRHYVHEGSFHAFGRLAERGEGVAEPGLTFAVADHYVPTRGPRRDLANPDIA